MVFIDFFLCFLYLLLFFRIPPFSHRTSQNDSNHSSELFTYEQRLSHFKRKCVNHQKTFSGLFFQGPHPQHAPYPIIYAKHLNFSYCMPSKTGSSTMVHQLLELLPIPEHARKISNPHMQLMSE